MIGDGIDRIDGRAKVEGAVAYSADLAAPGMAHVALVGSPIACGRVGAIDTERARAAPGVLAVLTHDDAPRLAPRGPGEMPLLLQDAQINYGGQPVAAVVATSLAEARRAVSLVGVRVEARPAVTGLHGAADQFAPAAVLGEPPDSLRGDPARALAGAPVRIEATYATPMHHHSALEPHAVLAEWTGDRLEILATLQGVQSCRDVVARSFGVPPDAVRVVARHLGGGFGSKGRSWWPAMMIAVMAARVVHRPVRLELTREEMFCLVGCRAASVHRVALGAGRDGRLAAIEHHALAQASAVDEFCDPHGRMAEMLYASPAVAVTHRLARVNGPHPTPMRPPGHGPGSFALECAMDELAVALGLDPLELRLRNEPARDPHSGLPWSSRALRQCLALGAERFGWSRRPPAPRATRDRRWLIGWGLASATYPMHRQRAAARATLRPDGTLLVQSATHDLGTGTYTVMSQVAADALGVPVDRVRFELGDSTLPESPRAAGSMTAASVAPAVAAAATALRNRVIAAACGDRESPLHGLAPGDVVARDGTLRSRADAARAESYAAIAARHPAIEAMGEAAVDAPPVSMHAFGANFAEVAVDADLGEVRVRRFVACYGAGRILNLKMARSQQIGGIVFGIGMALGEATRLDPTSGHVLNGRLTDYLLPVHADVPDIDVSFVPEEDPHVNTAGVKGIGMIGAVGVAAAIANAVFHATGVRVRDLPITPEKLLA